MTKRVTHLDDDEGGPTSSPWRLVNLSLCISAVLGILGGGASLLTQVPSRWILSPWYSKSSLETVSVWIKITAQIGLNLWLPASVLLLFFIACGFGRKLDAPRPRISAGLLIVWLAYAALIVTLNLLREEFGGSEASGAIGLIVGLITWPIIGVLFICGVWAAVADLRAMFRFQETIQFTRISKAWLVWAVIPQVLLVSPLWIAPSQPRAITAQQNDEFEDLCSTAGVRLMAKPAGPVRSIAYDWDPTRYRRSNFEYRLDNKGRLNSLGVNPSSYRALSAKKLLHQFDFSESRQDDYCHARSETRTSYAHCPSVRSNIELKAPYYAIDTFTADVLAYFEVNTADYLSRTTNHGPVRFEITLTDRRSGDLLGEMIYVVDRANGRACGANVGTIISHEAFYYDAINR